MEPTNAELCVNAFSSLREPHLWMVLLPIAVLFGVLYGIASHRYEMRFSDGTARVWLLLHLVITCIGATLTVILGLTLPLMVFGFGAVFTYC